MSRAALAAALCLLAVHASAEEEALSRPPEPANLAPESGLQGPLQVYGPGEAPRALALLNGLEIWQGARGEWVVGVRGYARPGSRRLEVEVEGSPLLAELLTGPYLPEGLGRVGDASLSRGPMTALAGPDGGGGLVALTYDQDTSPGGELRLGLGSLSALDTLGTWRLDLGDSGRLSMVGGFERTEGWTRSRVESVEYSRPCFSALSRESDCLPLEVSPLSREDRQQLTFGGSWQRPLEARGVAALSLEASEGRGAVSTTDLGRLEVGRARRLGLRGRFDLAGWEARGALRLGEERNSTLLGLGRQVDLDQLGLDIELAHRFAVWRDRVQARVDSSFRHEDADLLDGATGSSLLPDADPEQVASLAVRLDMSLLAGLSASLAFRWQDEGASSPVSGRLALAASLGSAGRVTLSAGQGSTRATLLQRHLVLAVAEPVDLSRLERFCSPEGVSCGFSQGSIPLVAAGNPSLEPAESRSLDLGWQARWGRWSLDFSAWRGREEVLSGLLPALGTELGRVSPDYGAYRPPPELGAAASGALLVAIARELPASLAPFLTLDPAGRPVFVLLTWGRVAEVDTLGLDLGVELRWTTRSTWLARYSFADFELPESAGSLAGDLLPGSPQHRMTTAWLWRGERLGGSLVGRWVDGYRSVRGPFRGTVPTWYTLDTGLSLQVSPRVRLHLEVTNLLDDRHFEVFGGDLLERRGRLAVSWAS